MELATLLERCRRGDALAWEALVREYQSRVYAVTRHYLRDAEEARDVAQDVFVRLYEHLDSFTGTETFKPWLLRMARNAALDRLRRAKARPPAYDVPADEALLAAEGEDPATGVERESRERLLHRALAGLSDKNREVLLLKEIQGLKVEEVAELLKLPIGTVKSRSSRARLELAARLRRLDPTFGTGTP